MSRFIVQQPNGKWLHYSDSGYWMDEWNMSDEELKAYYKENFGDKWEQCLDDALLWNKTEEDKKRMWNMFLNDHPWNDVFDYMIRPILKAMGYDKYKEYPVKPYYKENFKKEEDKRYAMSLNDLYDEWYDDFNGFNS
jgi:hypothetical protein